MTAKPSTPPAPPTPIHQRAWLVGGALRDWTGPVQEVASPVLSGGRPTPLGSCPLMGEAEALEALAAAVSAWGKGRGPWPSMTVSERIGGVERFLAAMEIGRAHV